MKKAVLVDSKYFTHDMKYERETLAAHGIEFVTTQVNNDEEYIAACKDADAVLICYADTNRNVISHLENCKVLVRYGVGFEVIDVDAATDYNIAACNIPHYCTEEVAVHNIALMLDCLRQITLDDRQIKSGNWFHRTGYPYRRFSKMTVGIFGFGKIARMIAERLKGFGCKILATDPYLPQEVFDEYGVTPVTKEDLCRQSDIISIQLPLNKETYHAFDKAEFDLMKKGVILINTGRGGIVNTEALCDAIDAGIIRAAGLDVVENEPITDLDSPAARILRYNNVVNTPHKAAQSMESGADLIYQVIDTTIKVLEGGELPYNVLNRNELLAKRSQ